METEHDTPISKTTAVEVHESAKSVWRAVRLLIVISFMLLVIGIGNLYTTIWRANQIVKVDKAVTEIKRVSDEVEQNQSQNPQAVAIAIRLIPEIHAILCKEFPDPTNCKE